MFGLSLDAAQFMLGLSVCIKVIYARNVFNGCHLRVRRELKYVQEIAVYT